MSEKIYALLLRLFPSHFRKAYGDDALQLFRDRTRDEKGFFPSLRLWFDLLADLAISVPREYLYAEPELLSAPAQHGVSGVPSFYVLRDESPRLGALLLGGMLSVTSLGVFSILLSNVKSHSARGTTASGQWQGNSRISQRHAAQRQAIQSGAPSVAGASTTNRDAVAGGNLDPAERKRVVDAAVASLNQYYPNPDIARDTGNALLLHEMAGDFDELMDGETLAKALTQLMQEVSHDKHLTLDYSEARLPEHSSIETPEAVARYRDAMRQQNCMFEKVEIRPHNIGYLKLNSFPDPSVCRTTATAAMASLNNADAIIFDLRDNRGGMPDMVALMAAYLFDHPEYLYNPREAPTQQSWTQSPVPGNRLADKPVYILTSARTLSGAEQFCYDLKMLKRATLVGETTGGAAHSGVWHRIDDHFGMGIPETKPINPFPEPDWAGTGVEPDVKVNAADALHTAEKLAETKLRKQ